MTDDCWEFSSRNIFIVESAFEFNFIFVPNPTQAVYKLKVSSKPISLAAKWSWASFLNEYDSVKMC